jgi:hypothetical protein
VRTRLNAWPSSLRARCIYPCTIVRGFAVATKKALPNELEEANLGGLRRGHKMSSQFYPSHSPAPLHSGGGQHGYGEFVDDSTHVVTVNVGGQRFATQLGTLRTHRGSVLSTLFTPPYPLHRDPSDGSFFLDRNGEVFGLIIDYLRTGSLVVPRDPVLYAILRREVVFYALPISAQLPPSQPLSWESAPVRYKHARVTLDEVEKTVEWEEGPLPADLHTRQIFEIVLFFTSRGYKVASEYTSRGSRGFVSVWLTKKETYPGADVAVEVTNDDPPYAQKRRTDVTTQPYAAAVKHAATRADSARTSAPPQPAATGSANPGASSSNRTPMPGPSAATTASFPPSQLQHVPVGPPGSGYAPQGQPWASAASYANYDPYSTTPDPTPQSRYADVPAHSVGPPGPEPNSAARPAGAPPAKLPLKVPPLRGSAQQAPPSSRTQTMLPTSPGGYYAGGPESPNSALL